MEKEFTTCKAYLLLVKALAKWKTVGREHKVEKFLNYIGKYYIERIGEDKHWIVKKNKSI